jgi:hypothetical protein
MIVARQELPGVLQKICVPEGRVIIAKREIYDESLPGPALVQLSRRDGLPSSRVPGTSYLATIISSLRYER